MDGSFLPSGVACPFGLLTARAQHHPSFAQGSYWLVTSVGVYVASIALVPLVFLPRGWIFETALEAARTQAG